MIRMAIIGCGGMICGNIEKGTLVLHTGQREKHRETLLFETESGKKTFMEFAHFVDCIENGACPETDGRESLQGLRVIWRLYDSERNGTVADLRGLGLGDFK